MIKGVLESEELLTGSEILELGYVDRAGVVVEDNYAGRTVGVAGYDIVFLDEEEAVVYRNDSRGELEEEMEAWFDDDAEEYMEKLDPVLDEGSWPWTS